MDRFYCHVLGTYNLYTAFACVSPWHIRMYCVHCRISLTKEVLEGLRCLFDTLLASNLLYNEELSNHELLMSGAELSSTHM